MSEESTASEPYPALRDADLTAQQREWRPENADDLWTVVMPWKTERWPEQLPDGSEAVSALQLTSGGDPAWDWRTVAFWRAALPAGWAVQLSTPYRITLTPPSHPEASD